MYDVMTGTKINLISRYLNMFMFKRAVGGTKTNQKGIHPYIYSITSQVHHDVCNLLTGVYLAFIRVNFLIMWISSTLRYDVFVDYMK